MMMRPAPASTLASVPVRESGEGCESPTNNKMSATMSERSKTIGVEGLLRMIDHWINITVSC